MSWVKSLPSRSAKAKKDSGRKQLAPKSRATILLPESFMKLEWFMSQGHRRRPCSSTSGPKLTRTSLPVHARICVKGNHPETSEGGRGRRPDEEERLPRSHVVPALGQNRKSGRNSIRRKSGARSGLSPQVRALGSVPGWR